MNFNYFSNILNNGLHILLKISVETLIHTLKNIFIFCYPKYSLSFYQFLRKWFSTSGPVCLIIFSETWFLILFRKSHLRDILHLSEKRFTLQQIFRWKKSEWIFVNTGLIILPNLFRIKIILLNIHDIYNFSLYCFG